MFQTSCVEWWAAILTYLWFKGCKNIMHHHRVLKYGANRHINFENCQYKLNYHLRPPLNQLFCSQRTCLWHWKADLPALFRLETRGKGAGKYLLQIPRPDLLELGQHPEKNPKGRIYQPRWWQEKMWAHSWICGYPLTAQ